VNLALIGSGPNDDNRDWTRRFFERAGGAGLGKLWGWGAHHYSWNVSGGRTRDWFAGKGDALRFGAEQYYELLGAAEDTETLIVSQWGVMAEDDRQHRVKLVVDEWGSWHAPGTEPFPEALLGQQNTMRDALLAGLSFDIFHRHAEKVAMANIAQLVNCLQSLFFAHEDKFAVTPTYHTFALYADHQGGQSVRTEVAAPAISYARNQGTATIRRVSSSASLKGKTLTLTVNNLHMERPASMQIALRGGGIRAVQGTVLAGDSPSAHNSFANPEAVTPRAVAVASSGNTITHTFAPASVTKLTIELA
jgi:alpha-N-arabinofuranosidase